MLTPVFLANSRHSLAACISSRRSPCPGGTDERKPEKNAPRCPCSSCPWPPPRCARGLLRPVMDLQCGSGDGKVTPGCEWFVLVVLPAGLQTPLPVPSGCGWLASRARGSRSGTPAGLPLPGCGGRGESVCARGLPMRAPAGRHWVLGFALPGGRAVQRVCAAVAGCQLWLGCSPASFVGSLWLTNYSLS